MTARLSLFDHPFFLGFDHLEQEFDRLRKSSDGYPPYNVEQTGENGLRITLAVAGFTMNDLEVAVENKHLIIRGKQQEDEGRVYLHRGIAARQFQRSFVLADGIEVAEAYLDNGLLHVNMLRVAPEQTTRKIEIRQNGGEHAALNGGRPTKTIDVTRNTENRGV